jgi:hypothetical protein
MQPATRQTTAATDARTAPASSAMPAVRARPTPYPRNNYGSEAQTNSRQRLEKHAPTRLLSTEEVSAVETWSLSMWIYAQSGPLQMYMEICRFSGSMVSSNWRYV